MSDDDDDCPPCPPSLPAWMATFADLMSLLMCFFVLLLSFSEMDAQKFKRLAGELRQAYGVQTTINADDPPKGTSIIAQNFSPSIPQPTPIDEIRQSTSDITKSSLEVLCQDTTTATTEAQGDTGQQTRELIIPKEEVTPQEVEEKALEMATDLEKEISSGQVELETQGKKIVIRIRENGSFKPGSAYVQDEFLPVLDKIREVLVQTPGMISVEGHTDNTPLGKNNPYKNNWNLSSARAVAVAEELFIAPEMDESRFMVVGHANTKPLVDNKTAENRAKNRRVEIIILQSDKNDDDDQAKINENDPNYDPRLNAKPDDFGLKPSEVF